MKKIITILAFTAIMLCGNIFTANAQGFSKPELTYSNLHTNMVTVKFSVSLSDWSLWRVRFMAISQDGTIDADVTINREDVQYFPVGGGSSIAIATTTLTGLTRGTNYEIKAFYNFGIDEILEHLTFEESISLTTLGTDLKPPLVPNSNIIIDELTETSVKLSWYSAIDNRTSCKNLKYKIYYKTGGSCGSNISCWETTADGNSGYINGITGADTNTLYSHTISGLNLLNNTEFNIVVEDAEGNKSTYLSTFVEYGDIHAPQPTTSSMTTGTITENSIQMSWGKFIDNVTPQNQLRYKPWYFKAGGAEQSVGWHTDIDTWTFTDLEPNTEYHFGVTVCDAAGNWDGIYGGPATTLAATAPTVANKDLNVLHTTSNVIFLSWNEASHAAGSEVRYRVAVFTEESYAEAFEYLVIIPSWSSNYGLDGTACMITQYFVEADENFEGILEDLEPETTYYIAVQAYNAADISKFVFYNVASATTAEYTDFEPPYIEDKTVTIGTVTSNKIPISFQAATDNMGSENLQYRVFVNMDPEWEWWHEWSNIQTGGTGTINYTIEYQHQGGDWPLTPNTTYYISVWVVDEAGNYNEYNHVSATTSG
ncbi:hypothetical protein LJC69_06540, partial [Bacteroidales bacterium OttesenSCG-928-K22]|nr:hypothetical protein [Bacteroidales bacterium OttesenSCG-928-K22]